VCPVNAIFLDQDLPAQWAHFAQVNADFFQAKKPAPAPLPYETAMQVLDAVKAYAAGAGLSVAAAVVDSDGAPVAQTIMDGLGQDVARQALDKAYTCSAMQVPTDELRGKPAPASVDPARYVGEGGAIPIIDGPWVLGAIGVAGGVTPVQDVQCCRAGLALLKSVNH
jgi:uncharacterized protein GlcG (DUF336 family)